ncbi:MAG: calcium-binding protein [Pseudomonadota bacterium]
MANILFSAAAADSSLVANFDAAADTLVFDTSSAAGVKVLPQGTSTTFQVGTASVTLPIALAAIAASNTSFNDGSTLVIGDAAAGTTGDDGVNVIDLSTGSSATNANQVFGLGGSDVITLGSGASVAYGNVGDDVITGGSGAEFLYGGQGADSITGGDGANVLYGNLANDTLTGGANNDVLYGGQGDDNLAASGGSDVMYGNLGNDNITGGALADVLYGGQGADTVNGGDGNDAVYGNIDADVLNGDAGNDALFGGQGADTIDGGAGADSIGGNRDNDVLTGGAGNDAFNFAGGGADVITDFNLTQDTADLSTGNFTTFQSVLDAITEADGNSTIALGGGNSVTLNGITKAQIESAGSGWISSPLTDVSGQSFTLVTTGDNITGTGGADTIFGAIDDNTAANNTFTVLDIINGGIGTDQFFLTADTSGAGLNLPAASVSNVEQFFFRNVSGQTLTVDANLVTGEEQLWSDRSTNNNVFTNVGNGTVIGVKGDGVVANANTTATYGAAVTAGTLAIDSGTTAGDVAINGTATVLDALTVSSTGASNTIGNLTTTGQVKSVTINATTNLTATSVGIANGAGETQTLTVSGSAADVAATATAAAHAAVVLGTLDADFEALDASGLTSGGVQLTMNNVATVSYKGGAGVDEFTTGGVALTTGSVDAGAGTDVLTLANSTDINSAALGAKYTNFEVLQVNNGTTLDLDFLSGITAIRINDAGGATGVTDITADQAANITAIAGNAAGAITIGVKGAATVGQIDTVKITADDFVTNTVSTVDLGAIGLASVEKLELTAVDNLTITALTSATSLDSIKVSGGGVLSLTSGAIAPVINYSVDASALTGTSTINFGGITAAGNALSIVGGSKADAITTSGVNADVVDGRDGIDAIVITQDAATAEVVTVISSAEVSANSDLITGFETAEDKFDYNGTLANGTGAGGGIAATEVASAANIAAALATGDAANDIVFIATTDLTGAQETALDAAVAGGMTATEADAVEAALVATGGALAGTIANLDTVLGSGDSALFQFSTNTDTMVLRITNTDTTVANTLTTAEVELVGVFAGATDLVAADYL